MAKSRSAIVSILLSKIETSVFDWSDKFLFTTDYPKLQEPGQSWFQESDREGCQGSHFRQHDRHHGVPDFCALHKEIKFKNTHASLARFSGRIFHRKWQYCAFGEVMPCRLGSRRHSRLGNLRYGKGRLHFGNRVHANSFGETNTFIPGSACGTRSPSVAPVFPATAKSPFRGLGARGVCFERESF